MAGSGVVGKLVDVMHKKEGAAQKNAAIALARLAKDGSCLVNVRVLLIFQN